MYYFYNDSYSPGGGGSTEQPAAADCSSDNGTILNRDCSKT